MVLFYLERHSLTKMTCFMNLYHWNRGHILSFQPFLQYSFWRWIFQSPYLHCFFSIIKVYISEIPPWIGVSLPMFTVRPFKKMTRGQVDKSRDDVVELDGVFGRFLQTESKVEYRPCQNTTKNNLSQIRSKKNKWHNSHHANAFKVQHAASSNLHRDVKSSVKLLFALKMPRAAHHYHHSNCLDWKGSEKVDQ